MTAVYWESVEDMTVEDFDAWNEQDAREDEFQDRQRVRKNRKIRKQRRELLEAKKAARA